MSSIKLLNRKITTRGFHLLNPDGGIWSLGARPNPDLGPSLSLSAGPTPVCGPGWGEEKRREAGEEEEVKQWVESCLFEEKPLLSGSEKFYIVLSIFALILYMHTVTAHRHTDLFKSKKLAVLILKVTHVFLYIFNINMMAMVWLITIWTWGLCLGTQESCSNSHHPTTWSRFLSPRNRPTKKWNLFFTTEYHGIDHYLTQILF